MNRFKLGHYPILAVLTDHGTQFCASKRDGKGCAEHEFEQYLEKYHIKHILCRVKHLQTNEKREKFHDLYNVHRPRFGCLDDFVCWYNDRPHGTLNLWEAESPNMAFVRRLWPEFWLGLTARQFG